MSFESFDEDTLAELRRQVAEATGARVEDVTQQQLDAYVAAALAAEEELGESTLHRRFEQRVARSLDSPAVVRGREAWSAAELDERANRIARWLGARGVVPGDLVPLCMARSRLLIAAMLGVLKAGAAYLLLDPADPAAHVGAVLDLAFASKEGGKASLFLTDATSEQAATAAIMASQSSRLSAIGLSTITCLPCSAAQMTCSRCASAGVAT